MRALTIDKERYHKSWEDVVEEVLGGVVVGGDQDEQEVHAVGDAHSDYGPHQPQPPDRMDPVESIDIDELEGNAKAHADDEEQNPRIKECGVEAELVVGVLDELSLAALLVEGDVDYPRLRHGPVLLLCVVVDEDEDEQAETGEEQVELVPSGGLHDESDLFAQSVDLPVEVQTQHQVDEPVQGPDHVLIDIVGAAVKAANDEPETDEGDQGKQQCHDHVVHLLRILHLVHDNIVREEEAQDVQVVGGAAKVEETKEAVDVLRKPEGTPVLVDQL